MKPLLEGELGFMPLSDLFHWLDRQRKTVSVSLSIPQDETVTRSLYFQDGQVIFVSSNQAGERFGEFITYMGFLDEGTVNRILVESRKGGLCFTQHLMDSTRLPIETLSEVLSKLAETMLMSLIHEPQARFEISGSLPAVVKNGPVRLESSHLLMDVTRSLDARHGGH